jgi:hypothetical protein
LLSSLARKSKQALISLASLGNKKILREKVVLIPSLAPSDFGHYSSIIHKNIFVNSLRILDALGK